MAKAYNVWWFSKDHDYGQWSALNDLVAGHSRWAPPRLSLEEAKDLLVRSNKRYPHNTYAVLEMTEDNKPIIPKCRRRR